VGQPVIISVYLETRGFHLSPLCGQFVLRVHGQFETDKLQVCEPCGISPRPVIKIFLTPDKLVVAVSTIIVVIEMDIEPNN